MASAKFLEGDRTSPSQLRALIDPSKYEYVYDMNARKVEDVAPLAEMFVGKEQFKQYVFMSSAGVYMASEEMPHVETDPTDPQSRHVGKLESEQTLRSLGIPFCSFRPTYICGPQNYNPVERYFFERIAAGRPVCIPGHGQHLTGLGHVYDLSVAFCNVIGREQFTTGQVYNIQNTQAITFDGVAKAAAKAAGVDPSNVKIVHYNPDFYTFPKGKKAFPMRPQHFFTGITKAMKDLDWNPVYDSALAILEDSYQNDFVPLKESGGLKGDFECDDIILSGATSPPPSSLESMDNAATSAPEAAAAAAETGPKPEWMQSFDDEGRRLVKDAYKETKWMTDTTGTGRKMKDVRISRKNAPAAPAAAVDKKSVSYGDFTWS
mmetsp:Transcript_26048/g.38175  ORF Transcript_26048/g.38175 Transcript_26048/m.38175 type:complete len:377 (+) Transcript_26048:227-1357(+)